MSKFLSKFLIDDNDAYYSDAFCAIQTIVCIMMIIAAVVLIAIPEIVIIPHDTQKRLVEYKREIIFNRLDQEKTYVKTTTAVPASAPAKAVKEAPMSVVPLVFSTTPAPMTKKDSVVKEEVPQKVEHKNVPANLKAVPNNPLSTVPVHSNFVVTKGPTYTWKSSGNTVKIVYPDGTTEIVSKSLLPYLLGNK